MTDTALFEWALARAGRTQKELAAHLNISDMALYNKKNNHSEFKASEISSICAFLGLSGHERDSIFFAR